jgi:hypothetical protein
MWQIWTVLRNWRCRDKCALVSEDRNYSENIPVFGEQRAGSERSVVAVLSIRGKRLNQQVAVYSCKILSCNNHPVHSSSSTRCTKFLVDLEFLWLQPTPRREQPRS